MSIVAWDGKNLAADNQGTNNGLRMRTQKIFQAPSKEAVMAFTGDIEQGLALLEWFTKGEVLEDWPSFQKAENWTRMICASKGRAFIFELLPIRQYVFDPFMAWGSGRDFAMGAMAQGASATEAILKTNIHCEGCGMGVTSFPVDL